MIQAIFPGPVRKWVEEASENQKTQVLSLIGTNFIAVRNFNLSLAEILRQIVQNQ